MSALTATSAILAPSTHSHAWEHVQLVLRVHLLQLSHAPLVLTLVMMMCATPVGKVITVCSRWPQTTFSQLLAPRVLTTIRPARLLMLLACPALLVWSAHTLVRELLKLVSPANLVWLAQPSPLPSELTHVQRVSTQMLNHSLIMSAIARLARMVTSALRELTFFITL
jgi:hypothetical protein